MAESKKDSDQVTSAPFRFRDLPAEIQHQIIIIHLLTSLPIAEQDEIDLFDAEEMSEWDQSLYGRLEPAALSGDLYKPCTVPIAYAFIDHFTNPLPSLWHVNQKLRTTSMSLCIPTMLVLDLREPYFLKCREWMKMLGQDTFSRVRRFEFFIELSILNASSFSGELRRSRNFGSLPAFAMELSNCGRHVTVKSTINPHPRPSWSPEGHGHSYSALTFFEYVRSKVLRVCKQRKGLSMNGWDAIILAMDIAKVRSEGIAKMRVFRAVTWSTGECLEVCTRVPQPLRYRFREPWAVIVEGLVADEKLKSEDAMEQVLSWWDHSNPVSESEV